ncbi:tryptophan-rich sensory protein TspO [Rhodobacter ferrooxidans]|uniref:TspO and MBR like protein n=1 Tax=Rhodobacter ferrooxidans TaxID=371731 RepID=C8RYP7_9RHOB|nr:TspO/MBR family protein [Rhodobacter sp. SW2]EEW26235.1 TspO and MBR like protein [Rhodobacter sp. SW2]
MDWTLFLTYLAACGAAATTGAMIKPGPWYAALQKPSWTPPDWVFPVVWFILYFSISYAAMRVALLPDTGQALAWWSVQIALNTLWTPVFFGLKRMQAGLVVIACLWLAVAATVVTFFAADWVAGLLMFPYLVWASIAGALNYSVWKLNPNAPAA